MWSSSGPPKLKPTSKRPWKPVRRLPKNSSRLRLASSNRSNSIGKNIRASCASITPTNPKPAKEPFLVAAIYHDDKFTYIKCAAQEKPTVYELKDGKPNLVNFDFENGVYVIPKIVDHGYLAVGKQKVNFDREPQS